MPNLHKTSLATPFALPVDLAGWLSYIEAQHPKSIAMGLNRVNEVKQHLKLNPDFPVITVAGTNGKGSTCAMLERIYHEAGYRVACYSSPHLLRYNERVRIDCLEASDEALCNAFLAVETARGETLLTYFEFATLAAMWHFMQSDVDVAILEVGLGGRLDAVNIFDPACTIVTGIDLDHMDFLGNSRESIGYEKAGIFRQGIPAICGDINPPGTLVHHAASIGADLMLVGRNFEFKLSGDSWTYRQGQTEIGHLPLPALVGDFQLFNAACVITAIEALQQVLPVTPAAIVTGLRTAVLAGRFQLYSNSPQVILDVAHNPHAASALAENLRKLPCHGRTLAVLAMLADKDIAGVVAAVSMEVDGWYVAGIDNARGASALQLVNLIHLQVPDDVIQSFPDVTSAYLQACMDASENDRIVVFGSFFTVADVMRVLTQGLPDN